MKVLLLVHLDLVPPENIDPAKVNRFTSPWITEYDVKNALIELGHEVQVLGIYDDINPLIEQKKFCAIIT